MNKCSRCDKQTTFSGQNILARESLLELLKRLYSLIISHIKHVLCELINSMPVRHSAKKYICTEMKSVLSPEQMALAGQENLSHMIVYEVYEDNKFHAHVSKTTFIA